MKKKIRAILACVLALAMLPVQAAWAADDSGQEAGEIDLSVAGSAVVGYAQTDNGIYIMSTDNGEEYGSGFSSENVYLKKYNEDMTQASAEYNVVSSETTLSPYTETTENSDGTVTTNSYLFYAETPSFASASDDMHNAAITTDSDGNIYIAYQVSSAKSVVSLAYIGQNRDTIYTDCICDLCDYANGGTEEQMICHKMVEDESSDLGYTLEVETDCPVCNAWHRCYQAGDSSGFSIEVVKLDPDLNVLQSLSISAGQTVTTTNLSQAPNPYAIDILDDGSIILAGQTQMDFLAQNSPVKSYSYWKVNSTPDYAYTPKNREKARGFVIKIDSSMTGIQKCTYLGGMRMYNSYVSGDSFVSALAHDSDSIYAGGGECSGNIYTESSVLQPAHSELETAGMPTADAFIAKLDPQTLEVTNGTYYGGSQSDYIVSLAVKDGVVYAGGCTASDDLNVSSNAFQKSLSGKNNYNDCFILRLPADLTQTGFAATYIGGTTREDLYDIDVSADGSIYFTGEIHYSSDSYPTTDGTTASSIYSTIFASSVSSDCSKLRYSTITGAGAGRTIDISGNRVVVGAMGSEDSEYVATVQLYPLTLAHACIDTVRRLEQPMSSDVICLDSGDVNIVVTFSSNVEVTGEPRILLNSGGENGEARYAVYREPTSEEKATDLYKNTGNGTKKLIFTYEIQQGDTTGGELLNAASESAFDLNGGSIVPRGSASGSDSADLTVPMGNLGLKWSGVCIGQAAEESSEYDVSVTIGEEAPAVLDSSGDVPVLTMSEDYTGFEIAVDVSPEDASNYIAAGKTLTVIWTQMRGSRMIASGSQQLTTEKDTLSAGGVISDDSAQLETGDVIKIFVTEDDYTSASGDKVLILNKKRAD